MKVELLHIADCPNTAAARQLLSETLGDLGVSEEVRKIEVCDSAQAEALCFPGSPTIRVNGVDVETSLPRQDNYALSCRTYLVDGRLRGLPSHEMIRKAIQSAIAVVETEANTS